MEFVKTSVQQIIDTYNILNTTLKPDIFFKRLNFLFDKLLLLQKYEKYGIFTENNPTKRIRDIQAGLESRVACFVSRYMNYAWKSSAKMKASFDKEEKFSDFANKLISAFDCAHTFWEGNRGFPHYTGPLFTDANYQQVQAIWDESCDKSFDDMIIHF